MNRLFDKNDKEKVEVKITKNTEITLFGINSYSSGEHLRSDISILQNKYIGFIGKNSKGRRTIITIIKKLEESKYHIVVAGYIKSEKFTEFKLEESEYAMITIRGYIKRKIRKSVIKNSMFFFNEWLKGSNYIYKDIECLIWTEKRDIFIRKNTVDILFSISRKRNRNMNQEYEKMSR